MRTLYHHVLSAPSRLIRIVLAEKSIEADLKAEKDWERRRDFLKLNPAGEVPVLVESGGSVLADAGAIAEYLEEMWPEPALVFGTAPERAEIRRLAAWFGHKFSREVSEYLVGEKLLKRFLGLGEPDSAVLRAAVHNLRIHLDYIDYLVDRRHYLAGDMFSLADAAAAAHLSVADYFGDVDWSAHPLAKDWYMRVKSRRALRGVLADRIPGLEPPKYYDRPDF